MNIAMLMSVYGEHAIGGAERTAAQVAQALGERGHTVSLISLDAPATHRSSPATAHLEGHPVSLGVTSYRIPLVQSYDPYNLASVTHSDKETDSHGAGAKAWWHLRDVYNRAMSRAVGTLLSQLSPQILLTHTLQGFSVGVWGVAAKQGIRVVHMTHDHALICPATAMTRGTQVCERVCTRCQFFSVLRRTAVHTVSATPDAVIGPSQIILDRHRQFGWFTQVDKQFVIPNALPPIWQGLSTAPQIQISDHPTILHFGFLGRLDESKGADTILQAFARLPARWLGTWRLHMGGSGDAKALLERARGTISAEDWQRALPYIDFAGVVSANTFMRELHVLIAPSRAHETFCNVVLEAASLGVPAIVSERGALPERVAHGRTGWITPASDAAALTAQLTSLLEDPSQIVEKALLAWQDSARYSTQEQANQFEAALTQVLHDPA